MKPQSSGLPSAAWVPAALGLLFVALPIVALADSVDWGHLPGLLTADSSLTALWLSLRTATAATVLAALIGLPLAFRLARSSGHIGALVRSVVLVPLVLPPVVSGIALLSTFGRRGLLGAQLDALGVHVAFSTMAVVIAETFVAMPFLVISVEGAVRAMGRRPEMVATTLGASPWMTLRRVTLPAVWPAIRAGLVLTFARALGEFGATITFAGSLQGVTRTLPLEIYLQREVDPDTAVALSLMLVVVAALVIVVTGTRAGRTRTEPA